MNRTSIYILRTGNSLSLWEYLNRIQSTTSENIPMKPLFQIVDRVASSLLSRAVERRSFFINDIPRDFMLQHPEEFVEETIMSILTEIVDNVQDECIRFSASLYGCIVVFEIEENGYTRINSNSKAYEEIQERVEKYGACIHTGVKKRRTHFLSFSFPDLPLLRAA